MSSRSRNFRRRAGDDEDDADDTPNIAAAKPSPKPSATAAKPKKPPQQGPKRLSFVDDDEESETSPSSRPLPKPSNPSRSSSSRLGKPSSSHKITAVKDRLAPSSPAVFASNVQPQAGTYTKEALRELQKNTRTLASSSSSRASSDSRPVSSQSQPIVLLRGLVKPISETVREAAELDSEDEGEDGGNEKDKDDSESRNRLASMRIGKGKDASLFPDQATIDAIRAKRERLRQSRAAAPDYIALDGGSNHGEREGLSDEEPEFQSRIAMFGEKVEGVKKGVFESMDDKPVDEGLKDDDAEDNDEDEEEKIWEEEQFRKGLGKRMDDETSKLVSSVPVVHTVQQQKYTPMTSVSMAPSIGGVHGATQSGDALSISQKAEVAMKALQENARRIKESHGRTVSSLTKTDENLSASLLNITALESSLSAAGEKFIFMQKLRDFVSVICDFLQHKAPYIEELEEQMQKLHEARASAIMERRTADNEDEIKEVEAAVDAAMYELSKGGNTAALLAAAKSAAQAASAAVKEQKNLPPKLDEMGRDLNLQKRMDMRRRAEARQRRKAISDSKRMSAMEVDGSSQRIEGESSTDESDSESVAYQSNRDTLLQTADLIFSDASEEYSQLSVVKERFERWKTLFSSSYRDAYMALSVPAIFSPYVRLELLKWDPLHKESDFFDMNWHSLLFDYGMLEGGSEFSPDDADANLVPGLVEKVALPILHHEVVHCWDMLSSQETKNAVSATGLVTNYVPASSEALGELLVAIRTRLGDAVMNVMVPTWSPLILKAVPNAARVAAYRFGVAVRLLRNISLWKDILALSALEKLALDELLCGKILPHVRCITPSIHDAVTRSERIIASLSGVWTGPSVTGGRSRKLQPLVDYVQLLGKTLEKKHFSGMTESETSGLARRLKKMLVELNEYDSARDMARTFCLKEAL